MKPCFENVEAPKISCKTETLDLPPVRWPKKIEEFEHQNKKYRIRPIDLKDIPIVASLYNTYYPHLYQSSRHFLLEESFYKTEAALLSNWESDSLEKNYFIGLIETVPENEIIFAFGAWKDPHDRMIQALAIVLKPEYRGVDLAHYPMDYLNRIIEESGVDYAFGTAQARDVIAQKICLRGGYKFGGIMPGAFRWSFDGKTYYRDMLIYVYKFFNGAEKYSTKPKDWQLADKVSEVFTGLHALTDQDV